MTAPHPTASSQLVWESTQPFEARHEHALAALTAIAETLQAHRPLGGGEDAFLRLHASVRAMDARALHDTWRCPAAHAWTERTLASLGSCLGSEEPSIDTAPLSTQLDAFALFALAIAHRAGTVLALERPLSLATPVNLPGTSLLLPGGASAPIVDSRELLLLPGRRLDAHGCRVALVPEALMVPGAVWPIAKAAVQGGDALHAAHEDLLEEALGLVQRLHPATFAQLRDHLHVIAVLPEGTGRYLNATSSEHPGAMVLGACSDPFELADHLVHEWHHNRLFALEHMEALLEPDDPALPIERFYSPWRDEMRSLRGILHGAYVFVPVHGLYDAARGERPDAADQAACIALQLQIALGQLQRFAKPSALGRALIASLTERVRAIVAATPVPDDVRGAVRSHVRRFDTHKQVSRT